MTAFEVKPLSLHSLTSLIKMEERKRPLSTDQHDAAPPIKRQATGTNGAGRGHGDTDLPSKDDLEKFQKDAIFRQMQEYKRERNTLDATLRDVRKKTRDHDDHLRAIDAWLQQLVDELRLMFPDNDDVDMDSTGSRSSLLFLEQAVFEQHLSSRRDDIKLLVTRVLNHNKTASPELASLQGRISHLLAAQKESSAELERLRDEKKDLDERLENAIMRYMLAEKKLDRAKSVTAAKLENGLLLGGAMKSEESGHVKREDGTANGVTDHSEELADLETELKKMTATTEKQKEQIAKLEGENTSLTAKLTDLSAKFGGLTDEQYSKTELYKQLKLAHDDVVGRLNNCEALNADLKTENSKYTAERSAYQAQLESECRSAVAERDVQLGRAEADLARIRSNRDELLADRDIKKASLEQDHDTLRKIKDLASAQEDRIRALESENERLSSQSKTLLDDTQLNDTDATDIKSNYQDLKRKYELLTSELTSMQTAFQKTSKLANQKVSDFSVLEEKVSRLTAEKSKADQKYFATMKSKETLDAQVRTLRVQNTKSSDVVAQLKEAEANSRALIANLEKQVAEVKDSLTLKTAEQRSALNQSTTQGLEVSRLTGQLAELKQQSTAKDTRLANTSSACRTAEIEVEELQISLADARKNLESWKSKSGQSEQYEMLRQIAYCNICKKRLKDTVMSLCGHTFCHDCVQERYDNRARKCPNCSKPFGLKDFMRITL